MPDQQVRVAAPSLVTCARCSRTSDNPRRDGWMMRREDLVVQGVLLGLCRRCAAAAPDPFKELGVCNGTCDGTFRAERGTFFVAEWGNPRNGRGRQWSCWDQTCVTEWLNEQDYECDCCGVMVDMDVYKVVDGKRERVS